MTKILLGEISSYKAIVIAKYLKEHYTDIIIYTYDYKKFTSRIHTKHTDKHFILSNINIKSYLSQIAELIEKYSIDIFFPVHSDFIEQIIQSKSKFKDTLFYLGDYKDYIKLHNKDELQSIARELRLEIPKEYINFEQANIPFVAKPTNKSSSKGVLYIKNEKQKAKYKDIEFNNYIFQEYIEGLGCGYSVYAINGTIKVGYGHMRMAEYPISGGASVYRQSFLHDNMNCIASKILERIKWTGFAMFEFKLTASNRLILIEVNPRIWGSINQGLQNRVNYFEEILHSKRKYVLNGKEINTFLSPQIYLSMLNYCLHGNLRVINSFFKNWRNNRPDISFWNDCYGWLSMVLRIITR